MKALTHIMVGRTAIRALLVAVVVTAGIVGTVGTAAAEPMDGKGNDPYPPELYLSLDGAADDRFTSGPVASLDGKGNDVYPPPQQYAWHEATGVVGEAGTDAVTSAFPIDNVTFDSTYAGRGGGSGKPSF